MEIVCSVYSYMNSFLLQHKIGNMKNVWQLFHEREVVPYVLFEILFYFQDVYLLGSAS